MNPGFHVIAKPRGAKCNLACRYCFYLPKERLYEGRGPMRMADDVLETFVRQYIEAHESEVMFAWQGGEPTLAGLEFYARVLELQRKHARPGMRIANALQTNGTLLDDAWCVFLKRHDFLVGLSLDGPSELHDALRVHRNGRPSFESVRHALALLRRHAVEFNVLCVVNVVNAAHPSRVYRFFRNEGVRHLQFIPAVGLDDAGRLAPWSVSARGWGSFLSRIFDEWAARDVGRIFIQQFELAVEAECGLEPSLCAHARTCGRALAIEHNGDVFACDHYVDPAHRLGNVMHETLAGMVDSPAQQAFGRDKLERLPRQCRECKVLSHCNGGCPKDRFARTPEGEEGLNHLCAGYRAFFTHAKPTLSAMARLIHQGRPAAGVMSRTHLGRNAACKCGSGKKYKFCCLT